MPKNLSWKPVALILIVAAAVAAVTVLGPRGEEQPAGEEIRQKWFMRGTGFKLEYTEDNQVIENVLIRTPFPEKFENLHLTHLDFITENNDEQYLFQEYPKYWLENTLTERGPPVATVENTPDGMMLTIRINKLKPGPVITVDNITIFTGDRGSASWTFWAPENTSLYDIPTENRSRVYIYYEPAIAAGFEIVSILAYGENYANNQLNANNRDIIWWQWYKVVENIGWTNAPSVY